MTLTPDDIVSHEFKQRMRGYDVESVDGFLDRLADQIEATDREVADLRSRLRDAESRLAEALETESTLKRTLVTAQDAAQRALDDAREQADELRSAAEREVTDQLERAREQAERLVSEAREEHDRLVAEGREERYRLIAGLEDLRAVEERHRIQLRQHLEDTLTALDRLETVPPRSELVPPDDDPAAAEGSDEPASTAAPQDTEAAASTVAAEHAWAALSEGLDAGPTTADHNDPTSEAPAGADDPLFGSPQADVDGPGAPPSDEHRGAADEHDAPPGGYRPDDDRSEDDGADDRGVDDDTHAHDRPPPPPGSPEQGQRDLTVRVHEG